MGWCRELAIQIARDASGLCKDAWFGILSKGGFGRRKFFQSGQVAEIWSMHMAYIYIFIIYQEILCDLFGMVKWPFQRSSDLQLGDKKGHFESIYIYNYLHI